MTLGATADIVIATTLAAYDIARAWIHEHRDAAATEDDLGRDLSALHSRVNEDLRANARLHGTGDYQLDCSTWVLCATKRSRPGRVNNEEEEKDDEHGGDREEEVEEDDEGEEDSGQGAAPAKRARTRVPSPRLHAAGNAGDRDAPIVLYSESEEGDGEL